MAGDFSELDQWAAGLGFMEKKLADGGKVLFAAHERRYLDLARTVGGQMLIGLRPEHVDPDVWFDQVREFQALVFSRMMLSGMEITYEGRTEEDKLGHKVPTITYDDVLDWVKAGVENGGKDKTAIENNRGRADEAIAYDVHQAIMQPRLGMDSKKDYGPITARLEKWVDDRVLAGNLGDTLVTVLDAWMAALMPVMERDLADWVDEVIGGW